MVEQGCVIAAEAVATPEGSTGGTGQSRGSSGKPPVLAVVLRFEPQRSCRPASS